MVESITDALVRVFLLHWNDMTEQSPTPAPQYEIRKYVDPMTQVETASATAQVGEFHLSIIPQPPDHFTVTVFGSDDDGEMDVDNERFHRLVSGKTDDIEEIAQTYIDRINKRVHPDDLDQAEMEDLHRFLDEKRQE